MTLLRRPIVTRIIPAAGPERPASKEEVTVDRIHEGVVEIRKAMLKDMEERFSWNACLRETFAIASLVDPRYKCLSDFYVSEQKVYDAWVMLRWILDRAIYDLKTAGTYHTRGQKRDADGSVIHENSTHPLATENMASQASLGTASIALTNIVHQDGQFVLARVTEQLRNMEDVHRELSEYMKFTVLGVEKCPLEWWKEHKKFFPGLAAVARTLLCVPATSAGVERFFSASGLTITNLRTRLSTETVQQLLFLKINWNDSFYKVRLPKRNKENVIIVEDEGKSEEEKEKEDEVEEGACGSEEDNEDAFFALSFLADVAEEAAADGVEGERN
jgi:hypothetical protein